MPTDATRHSKFVSLRARIVRWSAVLVLGALGVSCTSTRDAGPRTSGQTGTGSSTSSTGNGEGSNTTTLATAAPTTAPPAITAAEPPTIVEPTTTTSPPTTTTPLVTEGAKIIVANATDVQGGAARLAKALTKVGYTLGDPTNAAGNEEFLDATKVYFLPDGEAVATGLATLLGVPLARMPTPAPITDATAGLGDATVLVMLGEDLAGKTPPGLKGR